MIDEVLALTTMRSRWLSMTILTTGAQSLSATATGFARTAGSFLTDGFAIGMEVTSSDFANAANNGKGIITAVSALSMTVTKKQLGSAGGVPTVVAGTANVVEVAGAGKSIAALVPMLREFDNTAVQRVAGVPLIEDRFVSAGNHLATYAAEGQAEDSGLYIVTWFGLAGQGTAAILRGTGALLQRFAPGTPMAMSDGNVIRVRGESRSEPRPQGGQIIPIDGGWAYRQVQIPWRARSRNTIAA